MADLPQPDHERALARLVLPTVADLWGQGWEVEASDDAPGASASDEQLDCLPDDLPDGVADADATFARPGALVHALATVFADVGDARRTWAAVAAERFARCFAESVARQVQLPGHLTLLGPVLPPADFALDRQGRRVVVHRASFSQADAQRLLPVELDLAAVLAGRCLVLVWAADDRRGEADEGWPLLVERLVLHGDVAMARDGS